MFSLGGHRLPLIKDCLKALAACREAGVSVNVSAPELFRMSENDLERYFKHTLARRLADLLIEDADISESVSWSKHDATGEGLDTEFVARTVVMKASTYHALCQALRHLQMEALEDTYRVKA